MVRRCWVNCQCQGVLLTWLTVGQGPIVLSVGAGGGCLDIFTLIYPFFPLSPSLWETAPYRLKYCLKGPLSPKQPTNQSSTLLISHKNFNEIEQLNMLTLLLRCLPMRRFLRSVYFGHTIRKCVSSSILFNAYTDTWGQ